MSTSNSPVFWNFHEGSPWRGESICYPEMYNGGAILDFACTQLIGSRNYSDQKKLVAKWCDTLPHLNEVQYVLFTSQMTQSLLEAISLMPQLKGLYIKWSSIQSVQPLTQLKNIERLHIGSSTRIADISVLSELKSLITLEVENVPSMKNIDFVSSLTNLLELGIHGSNWTFQHIDTLARVLETRA